MTHAAYIFAGYGLTTAILGRLRHLGDQPPPEPGPGPRARPRLEASGVTRRLWMAAVVVLGALGFLVYQGLGNATLYFRTADEAVAQRETLGDRRFRIEGNVLSPVNQAGEVVSFNIESNGVQVPITHKGDPPELFQPGIPVVLEGRFVGEGFSSDRILVKHSETYVAENPERVTTVPTASPSP